jgi:hypothetical protein
MLPGYNDRDICFSCLQRGRVSDSNGCWENMGGYLRACAGLSHDIWLDLLCTIITGFHFNSIILLHFYTTSFLGSYARHGSIPLTEP